MQKSNLSGRVAASRKFSRKLGGAAGRRRAVAAATAVALSGVFARGALATTGTAVWTGTSSDLWDLAGNWSPSAIPNNGANGFTDYNVSIGAPAPCVLTGFSPTIDNLTISSSGVLDIQDQDTLTLTGPSLNNSGSIVVNSNQAGATAELLFSGTTSITGTGTIFLNETTTNAQLAGSSASVAVTLSAASTVAGFGQINADLINNGVVNANFSTFSLTIGTYNVSNNLTFEATGGGILGINGIEVTQGTNGLITAANASSVVLTNATVSGGTLNTSGSGLVTVSGSSTIANVTSNGVIDIPDQQTLNVSGNLVNNGSIVVNSNQLGAEANLAFAGTTVISGTGTILLNNSTTNAQLTGSATAVVTQDAGHTIAGLGQINVDLINNGVVNANYSGFSLTIGTYNGSNNLTFEATGGGILGINGIQVTQGVNGVITAANASSVVLTNATVSGGTFNTSGTGAISVSGTSTITSVTNNGVIDIPDQQTLNVSGNLVDSGSIVVNSNSLTAAAVLNISGGTISGSGAILLQASTTNAQLNGSFNQSFGHTIAGYGEINASFTNSGLVNANVSGGTLYIESPTVRNSATLQATAGTLYFDSETAVNNSGGMISASGGGNVTLANGASITGGTLSSTSPSVITVGSYNSSAEYSANLNGVTLAAGSVLDVPYPELLAISGSTFTNNGTIIINSNLAGGEAELLFNSNTLLTGSGTIQMQGNATNAVLASGAGDTLTQDVNHSITGFGEITAALVNNGLVNANVNTGTLFLMTSNMSNNKTFEATNGGLLAISAITVTQGASGEILAGNASSIDITSSTITQGTLASSGSGYIQIEGVTTVSSITNSATLNIPYQQQLNVTGNLTNTGTIVVNSNTGGAVAVLNISGGTVSGSGSIVLQEPGNNAQLDGSLTLGAGQTIVGYGLINAAITNNGLINSNVSGQTLTIAGAITNTTTIEATNGGLINISGITVNQSGGQISSGAASVITLSNSNIAGGLITGAGNFNVSGTVGFSGGITSSTTVDIPYQQQLNITGGLTNNGTIVVNSNTGGAVAVLNISGGTLSGTGEVVLQQPNNNAQVDGSFTLDQTIVGYGQINAPITNNGLINANVSGQAITLAAALTNTTTIEGTNGGDINVGAITVTQTGAGEISAGAGSVVTLSGSNIAGGVITGAGSFLVQGTVGLSGDVSSSTTIDIPYNQQLNVSGGLTNNGTIVVNSDTGGAVAVLDINGGTLSGNGEVVLQEPGNNAQVDGSFTMAVGQTIVGYGQINASMTNNGIINSNVSGEAITLATSITNNNLIEASVSGASLIIPEITITQSADAEIDTPAGTSVTMTNSQINGGTIVGPGVWTVEGTDNLFNVSSSAVFEVPYDQLLTVTGNLTDNGSITINSNNGGAIAQMNFSGGTLSGTGTIILNQVGSNAQLDGPFTQAAPHTIQGFGDINSALTNDGTVDASVSSEFLNVLGTTTNNGTFQASGGGILNIASGVLTNFSGTTLTGGTYIVDAGSAIDLQGSIDTNAATIILSGVNTSFGAPVPLATNSGTLILDPAASFSTAGSLANSGTITTAAASGNLSGGSLTVNGTFNQTAGTTTDDGALTITGATNISGGLVTVGYGGTFTGTPITVVSGAQLTADGTLASDPSITDNGKVVFGPNLGAGILDRSLALLNIGGTGTATVGISSSSSNRTLLTISSLTIAGATNAWTGKLDLGNSDMDLPGASLATITNQIKEGYDSGIWQGSGGIISSAAAANTTHLTTLGVIQNNQSGTALYTASNKFDGVTPGASDILVKYTYYGDANLSGKVDASDYSLIDNGYLNHLTGWYNGDFNYDGVVNGSDYTLIDNAYNMQGAQISAEVAVPTDQIAGTSPDFGELSRAVPEPSMFALMAVGSLAMLRRRRVRTI